MTNEKQRQEILDWINHPVTKDLRDFLERDVQANQEALLDGNYYIPFEPHKTQENVAAISAAVKVYSRVLEYLNSAEAIEEAKEELSDDE